MSDRDSEHSENVTFACNLCESVVRDCPVARLDRDTASCDGCGSTVRLRSIVHLLSRALFGDSISLRSFPTLKNVVGIGLSDNGMYAEELSKKFDYTNTFLDREPRLDILQLPPSLLASCDFVISADVFEHVTPPPVRAFRSTFHLLKPGGTLILTVPFGDMGETVEHFPQLTDFRIVQFDETFVMVERDVEGRYQVHTDLSFHDGPGQTLEMRIYAKRHLIALLEEAGFVEIEILAEPYARWGIAHKHPWSLPIAARRPTE
jgi:SAM-dependent methyltransferase